jgi:hypothetical protein
LGHLQLSTANSKLVVGTPDSIRAHNARFVFEMARADLATSVSPNMR